MRLRVLRRYYAHFITILSLAGFMLLCFANCESVQLVPIEIDKGHVLVTPPSAPDSK